MLRDSRYERLDGHNSYLGEMLEFGLPQREVFLFEDMYDIDPRLKLSFMVLAGEKVGTPFRRMNILLKIDS
jgi:hypothetical protein